ncbi:tyrosine-type recombinase/integrase [Chitinimonas sp. PSY-7]|uniref:tyrosine-type recombinase/integrase n=1 Tax=Chitinimonas sp. PSY-7 TaxID=3459088 RepID=UPI00403FFACD
MVFKQKRKAPALSAEELNAVYLAINKYSPYFERDRAIIALAFYSGLRAKELANINLDVLVDGRGEVREVVQLEPSMTKGGEFGEIYISHPEARADVVAYIRKRLEEDKAERHERLFLSYRHKSISPNYMRQLVKKLFEQAGIKATSHSGRRTFATTLDQGGASLREVQALMRHRNFTTTMMYVTANPARLKKLVRKMAVFESEIE